MRRLALLLAGGAVWLFLAAIPALADGGPHIASANSGATTLTADGCAGCHRAHTAQGEMLLKEPSVEGLCLSCHGSTGTGATTDVLRGLQYTLADRGTTPILGALRNGGFEEAAIDSSSPMRLSYVRNNIGDVSTRPKVGVLATPEAVNSAHIDLGTPDAGIADFGIAWGNGTTGNGKANFTLECVSCHNPHGNGQYRILNPIPTDSDAVSGAPVNILSTTASNERITTTTNHGLVIGSRVTIAGNTGTVPDINGTFTVASVPSVTTFTLGGVNIATGAGASGTATAQADVVVTDSPLGTAISPGVYPTKNYTVLQVKGNQGTDASFLLFASDVVDARGANTKGYPAGDYSATGGDYFHRSVPWNPGVNNTLCDPTKNASTSGNFQDSNNPTACITANDAPNGRPATWSTSSTFSPDNVAFNDQITAWCSACHTRYYSNRNPNPGTLQGPPAAKVIIMSTDATANTASTGSDNPGLAVNDTVSISGHAGTTPDINGTWFVVGSPSTSAPYTFQISATSGGTALDITVGVPAGSSPNGYMTRTSQATAPIDAQSWWFPRPSGDTTYKYQHQTTTNRACTTCHVGHGSNAEMIGPQSLGVPYPGTTTTSTSSRLLKIDNRGTCQACHDPTATIPAGTLLPPSSTPKVP